MTTTNNKEILKIKPDFSFGKSIKTCLLPILAASVFLYFLMKLYIFIDINLEGIIEFFRVEKENIKYLIGGIYFLFIVAAYTVCCSFKFNEISKGDLIFKVFSCLFIMYLALMVVMYNSYENTDFLSQTENILYMFTYAPLVTIGVAAFCIVFAVSFDL